MKIIGVAYHEGERHIMLKSDSSLLNGRKPFFRPEGTDEIAAHPCLVCRIGRMGKHIEPHFAWRYIDGIASGLHLEDACLLSAARQCGGDWITSTAMDGAMPVGQIFDSEKLQEYISGDVSEPGFIFRLYDKVSDIVDGLVQSEFALTLVDRPEDIVALLSKTITLRQGDLIFICSAQQPFTAHENNCIVCYHDDEDVLFCKIK